MTATSSSREKPLKRGVSTKGAAGSLAPGWAAGAGGAAAAAGRSSASWITSRIWISTSSTVMGSSAAGGGAGAAFGSSSSRVDGTQLAPRAAVIRSASL